MYLVAPAALDTFNVQDVFHQMRPGVRENYERKAMYIETEQLTVNTGSLD